MTFSIILAIAEIFGLFAIGAAARFSGYIKEREIDRWSRLVLDFLFPAFTFTSITKGFLPQRLPELWPLPVIGLALVVFGAAAGMLLRPGLFCKDPKMQRTFVHFCAVNNSMYLPIIIIRSIWGESSVANLFFFNLGTTIGVWTIGVGVLGVTNFKSAFRNLLTPNLVAILVALAVSLGGAEKYIPSVITRIISTAGTAAVPMMLVLIGASLAHPKALHIRWPVIYTTITRLVLLPVLAILFLNLLPISTDVYRVAVVVSLMPVAVTSVIMTRRFGGSPLFAASTAFVTTICAIVTVPLGFRLIFQR